MSEATELDERDRVRQDDLGRLLTRSAARHPEKLALVWRETRETYANLNRSVNATAHSLADRGVGQGDRVALFSHNCRSFLVVYLALAKLGSISVPVNFMSRPQDLTYILRHSGAMGIVVEDALVQTATAALAERGLDSIALRGIILNASALEDDWEDISLWEVHPDTTEPDIAVGADDPVQIMYTSGTESRPKGATLTSRSLIAQYVSCIVDGGMTADDIAVHALPFYHCAQLHAFFGPDLYLGASGIILPGPDPEMILSTIDRERATKFFAPPTVWISLLQCPAFERRDLSSLRKGYYGASPMPTEVLAELHRRLPNVSLWNFYGQAEMAPTATILPPADQVRKAGSAGRPCINVETRIVDDAGNQCDNGEIGEIVHRSPQAMVGYWNDRERTAESFKGGWFHSGDLGYVDSEGYLYIVDRKKDMINSGGENVSCREVEEMFFLHQDVAEVSAFGVPHPFWVEAVAIAAVPKPGRSLTAEVLIEFGKDRLAGYKAPKFAVVLDELPKNPSGKILKRTLREDFRDLANA